MHRKLPSCLRGLALAITPLLPCVAHAQSQNSVIVTGVVYAGYGYQLQDTAGVNNNNFDITRAYVNLIGKFAGNLGTRVTADVYRNADGSLAYRLKYAYAAYTPGGKALTYKLGQIHTPWLDWEEALWDYRMQGQMALERGDQIAPRSYLSSSDFGFGVDGKWQTDRVNMQLAVVNGENYNKAPGDQRKDLQGRVSVRLLATNDSSRVGGLRLTSYEQLGKPSSGGTRDRFLGMLSYRSKQITLAGEFAATQDSVTAGPVGKTTGHVISAFGVFHVPNPKIALIGRVDVIDPNTSTGNNTQTRVITGASYQLTPNLRLLADLDHLSYEGGAPSRALEASRSTALVQAQFTF